MYARMMVGQLQLNILITNLAFYLYIPLFLHAYWCTMKDYRRSSSAAVVSANLHSYLFWGSERACWFLTPLWACSVAIVFGRWSWDIDSLRSTYCPTFVKLISNIYFMTFFESLFSFCEYTSLHTANYWSSTYRSSSPSSTWWPTITSASRLS